MTYWLCITNEENWHIVKQKSVWGVAERHRNTIAKVERGDMLVMYLKQEKIADELVPSKLPNQDLAPLFYVHRMYESLN